MPTVVPFEPTAALGVIAYGPPATVALDAAPLLAKVTLAKDWLPIKPVAVNAVLPLPKVTVSP